MFMHLQGTRLETNSSGALLTYTSWRPALNWHESLTCTMCLCRFCLPKESCPWVLSGRRQAGNSNLFLKGWVWVSCATRKGQDSPPEQDQPLSCGSVVDNSLAQAMPLSWAACASLSLTRTRTLPGVGRTAANPFDLQVFIIATSAEDFSPSSAFPSGTCKD